MNSDTHVFACFSPTIDELAINSQKSSQTHFRYHNEEIAHRLHRVIRIRPKEQAILFGKKYALDIELEEINSPYIVFTILQQRTISPLQPTINLWLPLLEKSALEQALYSATILGVHTICLITTAKSKRQTLSPTELQRFTRIMIAAAEQSKQFCLPRIHAVSDWNDLPIPSQPIMADIDGSSLTQCTSKLDTTLPCTLIIGPSGGFTAQEKQKFESQGILKAKLGPSILRSEDAVMVSLGIMRSLLNT